MIRKIRKSFSLEAYEAGAKVETRNGKAVRILATDIKGSEQPILAAVYSEEYEEERIHNYTKDGSYYLHDEEPCKLDLVIVEEVERSTWEDVAEGIRDCDWTINNGHPLSFETEEEALAFEAFYKLIQLRKAWIGDWKPDWADGGTKYGILNYHNKVTAELAIGYSDCLSFPTEEMRDDFLESFHKLLEKAKDLI